MMEFFNGRYRTAKKEHICEICKQKIQIGEKYEYESGKFDGVFFDRHYHIDCYMTLQDFLSDTIDDDWFSYDHVFDWWLEGHCYQCALRSENGGECDADMDRHIWCTKYNKRGAEKDE